MRRRKPRKKKVTFVQCSQCHKQCDVDELKIIWKEFRLVCEGCFELISGNLPTFKPPIQ